jgi:hypothetical protein
MDDHCNSLGVCSACGAGAVDYETEFCDDPSPRSCCTSDCHRSPADTPCENGLA